MSTSFKVCFLKTVALEACMLVMGVFCSVSYHLSYILFLVTYIWTCSRPCVDVLENKIN